MTESKKQSAEEVANAFHGLSHEEKKFFHLHVKRIEETRAPNEGGEESGPVSEGSSGEPGDGPDMKTREEKPKKGFFKK